MAHPLPSYLAAATPVPQSRRTAWFYNIAPAYAGVILKFVFWQDVPNGGGALGGALSHGLGHALLALVAAALVCHFLYYLVPGLLGMKTGLPLYIVGTSTYGVRGGLLIPGFLMGILQFGWMGVNAYFSALLLVAPLGYAPLSLPHRVVCVVWIVAGALVGFKGIRYVARVATFLPIVPVTILLILAMATFSGVGKFDPSAALTAGNAAVKTTAGALSSLGVFAVLFTYTIGFFATAGAAGADLAMNSRNAKDVQMGGLVGVAGAMIFAGGLALLIVAGAHGLRQGDPTVMRPTDLMTGIVGTNVSAVFRYLLALTCFPGLCFGAFVATNCVKTTLPKVPPLLSMGIGSAASILLSVTGWAGDVMSVFSVIGASFGPICGAMAADYLLAGRRWAGPRSGFNPAGWISWIAGFAVGASDLLAEHIPALQGLKGVIPAPPLAAFGVGFVLYLILAQIGLQSRTLKMRHLSNIGDLDEGRYVEPACNDAVLQSGADPAHVSDDVGA
jgi:cytosine permease